MSHVSLWPTTWLSPAKVIALLRGKYSTSHNNNRPRLVFLPETCLIRWFMFGRKCISLYLHFTKNNGCIPTNTPEVNTGSLFQHLELRSHSWGTSANGKAFNCLLVRTLAALRHPFSTISFTCLVFWTSPDWLSTMLGPFKNHSCLSHAPVMLFHGAIVGN